MSIVIDNGSDTVVIISSIDIVFRSQVVEERNYDSKFLPCNCNASKKISIQNDRSEFTSENQVGATAVGWEVGNSIFKSLLLNFHQNPS